MEQFCITQPPYISGSVLLIAGTVDSKRRIWVPSGQCGGPAAYRSSVLVSTPNGNLALDPPGQPPPAAGSRSVRAANQFAPRLIVATTRPLAAPITNTRSASTTHTGCQGAARNRAGASGASRPVCAANSVATSVHDDSFVLA